MADNQLSPSASDGHTSHEVSIYNETTQPTEYTLQERKQQQESEGSQQNRKRPHPDGSPNESEAPATDEKKHEPKVFVCLYCKKQFKKEQKRREHECRHTGERPYQCRVCDMKFRREDSYKIHQQSHASAALF